MGWRSFVLDLFLYLLSIFHFYNFFFSFVSVKSSYQRTEGPGSWGFYIFTLNIFYFYILYFFLPFFSVVSVESGYQREEGSWGLGQGRRASDQLIFLGSLQHTLSMYIIYIWGCMLYTAFFVSNSYSWALCSNLYQCTFHSAFLHTKYIYTYIDYQSSKYKSSTFLKAGQQRFTHIPMECDTHCSYILFSHFSLSSECF